MRCGISTSCFYPAPTEEAVRWLADRGTPWLEIFFNAFSETEPAALREMKSALAAGGSRALSVHPFTCPMEPLLFFSEYQRRTEEGLELYKRYFEAAAELDAEILVLHGDRLGGRLSEEENFARFAALAEVGRRFGVTVALENTVRNRSREPDFLLRMRKALGEQAAFVLDVKQARRSGHGFGEYLDAMGDRLCHLHLSDAGESGDCLPVGRGSEDLAGLFSALEMRGYQGGAILELYRENYREPEELLSSLAAMEGLAGK